MSDVDLIAALRRERAGYLARNLADRVALVDAELARFGAAVPETAAAAPAPERATPAKSAARKRVAR